MRAPSCRRAKRLVVVALGGPQMHRRRRRGVAAVPAAAGIAPKQPGFTFVRSLSTENWFNSWPAMCLQAGVAVEVVLTTHKGHAVELAKKYGTADCGLVAVGGDGTIHEVMDGLIEKGNLAEVPLGLLSQGTMSECCRSLRAAHPPTHPPTHPAIPPVDPWPAP